MPKFEVVSEYTPSGDQPEAIEALSNGIEMGLDEQTLLGVTGSGKTFTMAKVIEAVQRPTLVLAHNKTLAAQLCAEFKEFFPNNAVEYFVSYYDYYQPEAYIPHTDTYIAKDASTNDEIDRLRLSATCALLERRDVIVVSSVSCIYGLGEPEDFAKMMVSLRVGMEMERDVLLKRLVEIRYERNDIAFERNMFRVRGDTVEIYPAYYRDHAIRVEFFGDEIDRISDFNPVTGSVNRVLNHVAIYPASHYVTTKDKMDRAILEIRRELEHDGCVFQTSGDAELIAYLIARSRLAAGSIEKAVSVMMNKVRGAYSIVLMSPRKLLAVRDPNGFRPLCIGKLEDSYIFTSESCALDTLGAKFVRDVEPGEIVWTEGSELHSIRDHCGGPTSLCVFEHVYFARPDSVIDGASVHESRLRAGAFLARQSPVEADVVVGVPDSGLDAAIGYSRESGITYSMGFIKNRYIGRTFIQDTQAQRVKSVQIKLNPLRSAVSGKRVVLVDDSIVRGTTIARIVGLLRNAGAVEVHVRISSPPFLNPCYFGTDIDSKDKLIACRMTRDEICKTLGADSLDYLSLENLGQIAPDSTCDMCMGCFTGNYPIPVPEEPQEDKFARKLPSMTKEKKA